MEAEIKVKLKPFAVPNFVLLEVEPKTRQEGIHFDDNKLNLAQLDEWTLERLCDEFRESVFKKAKKCRPPQEGK